MNITIKMERSIGHRLLGYDGLCANLHGHNYVFEVTVQGNPNELGLVEDFTLLKNWLTDELMDFDHAMVLVRTDPFVDVLKRDTKLVLLTVNPSAENLASYLFNRLVDSGRSPVSVRVQETSNGWALATAVNREVRLVARS